MCRTDTTHQTCLLAFGTPKYTHRRAYLILCWDVFLRCQVLAQVERELIVYCGWRKADVPLDRVFALEASKVVFVLTDGDMAVERLSVVLCGDESRKESEEDSARDGVSVKRRHDEPSQLYALRNGLEIKRTGGRRNEG